MNRRALLRAALLALVARGASADEAGVKMLATLAVQNAFRELEPRVRRDSGAPVAIEYGPTLLLVDRLLQGERADVAILTHAAVQRLAAAGRVRSQTDLVRSSIAIAVASGAPAPVLDTTEDFVAFIEAVPSIAYTASGASGQHMARLMSELGLADVVAPKLTLVPDGLTAPLLVSGKVAAAVQQISELRLGGATNIVPLPAAIQSETVFTLAVLDEASQAAAIAEIVALLTSRDAAAAYGRSGVSPLF